MWLIELIKDGISFVREREWERGGGVAGKVCRLMVVVFSNEGDEGEREKIVRVKTEFHSLGTMHKRIKNIINEIIR